MDEYHVGYCITSHGYGHAARSVAVMEALSKLVNVRFTLVTMVPEWFFRSSFSGPSTIHSIQTDIGLVQVSALEVDLPATVRELHDFYPLREEHTEKLSTAFSGCQLVVSDIAPIGIAAADLPVSLLFFLKILPGIGYMRATWKSIRNSGMLSLISEKRTPGQIIISRPVPCATYVIVTWPLLLLPERSETEGILYGRN